MKTGPTLLIVAICFAFDSVIHTYRISKVEDNLKATETRLENHLYYQSLAKTMRDDSTYNAKIDSFKDALIFHKLTNSPTH